MVATNTPETNWETDQIEEVFLGNYGEEGYLDSINIIRDHPDREEAITMLRDYIERGNASPNFYKGWNQPPPSSYDAVNWDHVYDLCYSNAKDEGEVE